MLGSVRTRNNPSSYKYTTSSSIATKLVKTNLNIKTSSNLISAAYASRTWQKHDSAHTSFLSFCEEKGVNYSWPLSEEALILYTAWLINERGLKSSTAEAYLASLRCIHKLRNLNDQNFENFILKTIIRGGSNLESYNMQVGKSRKVMTLPLLKLIGHEIASTSWSQHNKQVFWSACTLAFFGSFRLGEILSPTELSFSEKDTLLWRDVRIIEKDHILIHLKSPKSRVKDGEFIDIFSFKGHGVCPVKSLIVLRDLASSLSHEFLDFPVFIFLSGKGLTSRTLNFTLHSLLSSRLGPKAEEVSGHSFRAGIPSVLARFPELSNSSDIKTWGRWKSDSYCLYTRLKNEQKRKIFSLISNLLSIP